jgi:hypothetical protein
LSNLATFSRPFAVIFTARGLFVSKASSVKKGWKEIFVKKIKENFNFAKG